MGAAFFGPDIICKRDDMLIKIVRDILNQNFDFMQPDLVLILFFVGGAVLFVLLGVVTMSFMLLRLLLMLSAFLKKKKLFIMFYPLI